MLQNPCKTLGFKKNMVYKIPPRGGGGGKPYPASGLFVVSSNCKCVKVETVTHFLYDYSRFMKQRRDLWAQSA